MPDKDLSYFAEGTEHFKDYVDAVQWAQEFARYNRELMMENIVNSVRSVSGTPSFEVGIEAVMMEAQKDLVEVVHILRQIVCVKG